jgi:hypothetical protein
MYLHSLFDDCKQDGVGWAKITKVRRGSPSNGFINASLAIVADAPARAIMET